ncbi:hypothetical protein HK098_008100 [Nowakowskiella sp. JEL0407]|nr:hypothetical protein HK098_008100 [Nowakowskiella sp. JEL0407]
MRLIEVSTLLLVFIATLYSPVYASHLQKRSKCDKIYVRKEWRLLTADEKERYFNATLTLFNSPSLMDQDNFHSDLVKTHADIGSETHMTNFFLPWHRYFVYMFEKRLQMIDPEITLPYFDWTMDSQNVSHSIVWQDFGGGGDESYDIPREAKGCIYRGPYAEMSCELPSRDCIKRQQVPGILPSLDLYCHLTLAYDDYQSFRERMEVAHNMVHAEFGGTYRGSMAYFYSPNDPIFYVHHAQIDRLWSMWQDRHPNAKQYPEPDTLINFGALNLDGHYTTVANILNITEDLCYKYANSVIPVYDDEIPDYYGKPYQGITGGSRTSFLTRVQQTRPLSFFAKYVNVKSFSPFFNNQPKLSRRDWQLAHQKISGVQRVPDIDPTKIQTPEKVPVDNPYAKGDDTKVDGLHHDPTKLRSLRPMADSWKFLGQYDKPFLRAVDAEYDRYNTYVNTIPVYESICSLHNLMRASYFRMRTDDEERRLWESFAVIEAGYQEVVKKAESIYSQPNSNPLPNKKDGGNGYPKEGY